MAGASPEPPPLSRTFAHAVPTWRAAYSDRTAAMMAHFSWLAYVPFVDDTPAPGKGQPRPEKDDGRDRLKALLEPGGFQLKAVFNQDNVQAFLAVNPEQFAVLAFRGTANLADWGINLNAALIPMEGFDGVRVHAGFWDTFHDMAGRVRTAVDEHTSSPEIGLYITGHSLGGALAQIASAVLERDNLAACYTYGSPRVANWKFDRVVKCPHYRGVDNWDLVPGVPPPWPWGGYVHGGDPRLLRGQSPPAVLRHDQDPLPRAWNYFWSLVLWPIRRTLTIISDHMIWNYGKRLDHIAELRAGRELRAAAAAVAPSAAPRAAE
jgi:triacylglycerol lipase